MDNIMSTKFTKLLILIKCSINKKINDNIFKKSNKHKRFLQKVLSLYIN